MTLTRIAIGIFSISSVFVLQSCETSETSSKAAVTSELNPGIPITLTSPCNVRKDTNYCAPVQGCILGEETLFNGRSFGRTRGPVIGTLTNGASCEGSWNSTTFTGTGTLACSDGTELTLEYHRLHRQSGTIFGLGETSDGRKVFGWSGRFAGSESGKTKFRDKIRKTCSSLKT